MSKHKKLDKIKSIFTSDQKEKLLTQDGKRNLYFDRGRKNFIKFSLDVKTTCAVIYKIHKEEINKKLKEIHGENINLDDFAFLVVELIANKFEGKPTFIDLKIGMNETILFNILQNSQLMLCYLPTTTHNNLLKKSSKNSINTTNIQTDLMEKVEVDNVFGKSDKDLKNFLSKTVIHYYNDNKKTFSKEKIKITEKEIFIFAKKDIHILIKDIKEVNIYSIDEDEASYKQFFKDYVIKGDTPKYCINIKLKLPNEEQLLIGRNTYEHFASLQNAIQSAICNFQNYFSNYKLNYKIVEQTSDLLATQKFIAQSCFTLNDVLINREKRKIFFKNIKEENITNIVNNIIDFKNSFQRNKYNESINILKNMFEIINEKMGKSELNKYKEIFSKEKLEYLKDINNKIKNICGEQNNIEEDENKINELKKIINFNMFDDLYSDIKDKFLSKYYDDNNFFIDKNSKNINTNYTNIIQKEKLLLGYYFTKIFNINKEEDILYFEGDEVEKAIKEYNDDLIKQKLERHYVLHRKK